MDGVTGWTSSAELASSDQQAKYSLTSDASKVAGAEGAHSEHILHLRALFPPERVVNCSASAIIATKVGCRYPSPNPSSRGR